MVDKVVNIKVCSPLKLSSGLKGKKPEICHYSYNLPLESIRKFSKQLSGYNVLRKND